MSTKETILEYQQVHALEKEMQRLGDELARIVGIHFETGVVDWNRIGTLSGWHNLCYESVAKKGGRKGRGKTESLPALVFEDNHGKKRVIFRDRGELRFYGFDLFDEVENRWLRLPHDQAVANLKEILTKVCVVMGGW
jgi:hypothetical protein